VSSNDSQKIRGAAPMHPDLVTNFSIGVRRHAVHGPANKVRPCGSSALKMVDGHASSPFFCINTKWPTRRRPISLPREDRRRLWASRQFGSVGPRSVGVEELSLWRYGRRVSLRSYFVPVGEAQGTAFKRWAIRSKVQKKKAPRRVPSILGSRGSVVPEGDCRSYPDFSVGNITLEP
jgi:hypothetical protein